jgi:hypothetical protein
MPSLLIAAQLAAGATIVLMAATVAVQCVTGGINLRGLLVVKRPAGRRELSPARVQMLVATFATAAAYMSAAVAAAGSGRLPEVDLTWLAGFGASQGIYLGTKLLHFARIGDLLRRLINREGT